MGNGVMDNIYYCCENKNTDKNSENKFPFSSNKDNQDEDDKDDVRNSKYKIILQSLNKISQNKLVTRSDKIKEKLKSISSNKSFNYKEQNNNNEFIPINYEIIPEKINNNMFDQGYNGLCYLIAGINAFNEIPSIFDQLFIDKEYLPNK